MSEEKRKILDEAYMALADFVIKISKKEEATPEELQALVGVASVLANHVL